MLRLALLPQYQIKHLGCRDIATLPYVAAPLFGLQVTTEAVYLLLLPGRGLPQVDPVCFREHDERSHHVHCITSHRKLHSSQRGLYSDRSALRKWLMDN